MLSPIIKKEKTAEEIAGDQRREEAFRREQREIEDLCADIPDYKEPVITRKFVYISLKNKG